MLDLIAETMREKLHFAWENVFPAHPPGPWREYDHPIFFYLKRGQAIRIYFEENRPAFQMEAGEVCYLPAFRRRRVELIGESDGEPLLIDALGISFRIFGNADLLSFWEIPFLFEAKVARELRPTIEELICATGRQTPDTLAQIVRKKKAGFALLHLIIQAARLKPDFRERLSANQQIAPALNYLHEKFRDQLNIAILAERCYMSKSQFHCKFKLFTGVSPLEYQQQLRFAEAKHLLGRTEMGIAEIGQACGWRDYFHFCRLFKKHLGCAPSAFRKNFRKEIDPLL